MRKTNNKQRKGFTIVELVIVIAVIAILAGVMIPTFGGIIETANRSADTQLVAQINTILFVEDMLNGDGNDAVEIQKIVRENGLELKTKSKGAYLWYDIDAKKVVLAGIDANGIVLDEKDKDADAPATKGTFAAATAPEDFIEGYLFLSTQSPDGLAEKICSLRSPVGNDDAEISNSLIETLNQLNDLKDKVPGSEQIALSMSALMGTTAVMTNNGLGYIGNDKSAVIRIVISADMTTVTEHSINDLLAKDDSGKEIYQNIKYVSFHSNVIDIEQNAIDLIKANSDMYFFYSNNEVEAIDMANGDIANLARIDEFNKYFKKVVVLDSVDGSEITSWNVPTETYTFTYTGLVYEVKAGTADTSYDFVGYSLYQHGAELLELCASATDSKSYTLTGEQKVLIEGEQLTIYRVYNTAKSDFKIGNDYYSSKTMTYMLANPNVSSSTLGGDTITVMTNTATLGSATETNLTIPSGVELLLPFMTDFTKAEMNISAPAMDATSVSITAYNNNLASTDSAQTYNKALMDGKTKLTIASNVTLNVDAGASVYVDAKFYTANTTHQFFITNNCGVLVVDGTLNSNGDITAYGVIRGNGTINATDGSVTEVMTIYDWYGGTNALYCVLIKDKISPFNQWKADNIRASLYISGNTKYAARSAVSMGDTVGIDFVLFSNDSNNSPLFEGSNAIMHKVCTTDGKIKLTAMQGTIKDNAKEIPIPLDSIKIPDSLPSFAKSAIELAIWGLEKLGLDHMSIKFNEVALPLSNFEMIVAPGVELTVSQNIYKVMPGSSITVETETDAEGNKVDGGRDGVLKIGTKVVICDSFDVIFETINNTEDTNWDKTERTSTTYEFINGGKTLQITTKKETRTKETISTGFLQWETVYGEWSVSSNSVATVNLPAHTNQYDGVDPAKLVVNGQLHFNGGAFAGNITSTVDGATITVNANVAGHEFPEGAYIQGEGSNWYDLYDPNLDTVPVLAGTSYNSGLTSGQNYKYGSITVDGTTNTGWQPQN